VLESALEGEITDHLGYDKHERAERGTGNARNGTRAKTVVTDVGPVEITVPRDRDGSFEPKIVRKRQRRLSGVDEMVISLAAKDPCLLHLPLASTGRRCPFTGVPDLCSCGGLIVAW
jgi:putative transposase